MSATLRVAALGAAGRGATTGPAATGGAGASVVIGTSGVGMKQAVALVGVWADHGRPSRRASSKSARRLIRGSMRGVRRDSVGGVRKASSRVRASAGERASRWGRAARKRAKLARRCAAGAGRAAASRARRTVSVGTGRAFATFVGAVVITRQMALMTSLPSRLMRPSAALGLKRAAVAATNLLSGRVRVFRGAKTIARPLPEDRWAGRAWWADARGWAIGSEGAEALSSRSRGDWGVTRVHLARRDRPWARSRGEGSRRWRARWPAGPTSGNPRMVAVVGLPTGRTTV